MLAQPYQLYVERTDAKRNMARFYAMSIEETLFGQACLTRRWGRIGAHGQIVQHSFEREDEAVRLFLYLLRQKRKKGYWLREKARDDAAAASVATALLDQRRRAEIPIVCGGCEPSGSQLPLPSRELPRHT